MNKLNKTLLWVSVCLMAGAGGGMSMRYNLTHRKDIVIKHIETTCRTVTYQDISVTADMTFFWVDTHSERDDFNDERVCTGTKLHLALMKSVKHCEGKGMLPLDHNFAYFYTCMSKYFQETKGPFHDGRDWVMLDIKSITFKNKHGSNVALAFAHGLIINPHYKENYYFKKEIFPEK